MTTAIAAGFLALLSVLLAGATLVLWRRLQRANEEADQARAERKAGQEAQRESSRRAMDVLEEAQRSEDRYRRIFELSPEGILLVDAEGTIRDVNAALERWVGIPRAALIGKPLVGLPCFAKGMGRLSAGTCAERIRRGAPIESEDVVCATAAGERRGRVQGLAVRAADGGGYLLMIADTTSLAMAEQQLRHVQKMDALGQLAGGIAHDLNNLLMPILGYAKLLLEDAPADAPARGDIEEILRAGERATDLTRQLLTFGRKTAVDVAAVDLNDVVQSMEDMLRRTLGEHIELDTALDAKIGAMRADPRQIEQAVMNLAINAREAMPDGGRIELRTAEVSTAAAAGEPKEVGASSWVVLTVRDTGAGIAPELLERIFEPFFTTHDRKRSRGLGLSIVYGIVRAAGGHIEVESVPARGTEFRLFFPRSEERTRTAKTALPDSLPRGTETILVAEDEHAVRRLAVRLLGGLGYRIIEADSGEAALRMAAGHEGAIDLLVTDVVMPRMSGVELAEALREQRPDVRVVFVTGFAPDSVDRNGRMKHLGPVLLKPYTHAALAALVRDVLDAPDGSRRTASDA